MHRPVMNPSVLLELDAPPKKRGRLWWVRTVWDCIWRVMLFEPLGFLKRQRVRIEDGTPFRRFCRAVLYRLAALPVLAVVVAAVMVFNGTHPPVAAPITDPRSLGVYHDPVSFLGEDGTRLEGWLVPVIDAKRVIEEKEGLLRKKSPAVVLVHDYGVTREQMLPMVRPLHEAGFVVMLLSVRGSDSRMPAGQTFGLNESGDVRAAVEVVRRRPHIDSKRVALIGVGTGATASLLAARGDPGIAAVVLDNPVKHSEDVLTRIGPAQWWLRWMRPMCKWTFDLSYGVDMDDVNLERLRSSMQARPCLMVDNGEAGAAGLRKHVLGQVVAFLTAHLRPHDEVASLDE